MNDYDSAALTGTDRILGDLVIPYDGGMRLRQGVVQAVTGPSAVSLRLGGAAVTIPGVPCATGYAPIPGDIVWCAQNGPVLIVMGSLTGRRPYIRARQASFEVLANSFVTNGPVPFDPTLTTSAGARLVSNSRLQVNTPGVYNIHARISRPGNNQGDYQLHVRKNAAGNVNGGSLVYQAHENNASAITAGYGRNVQASDLIPLVEGDYVEMWAAQSGGAAVPVDAVLTLSYFGAP